MQNNIKVDVFMPGLSVAVQNLTIQKKLFLGFSAILIIVTSLSYLSLTGFQKYSLWLEQSNLFNELRLDLQRVELALRMYAEHHDEASFQAHQAAVQIFKKQSDLAIATLGGFGAPGAQKLGDSTAMVAQYERSVLALKEQIATTITAQQKMLVGTTTLLDRLDVLQRAGYGQMLRQEATTSQIGVTQSLSDLSAEVQNLRLLAWRYVKAPEPIMKKTFFDTGTRLKKTLTLLKKGVPVGPPAQFSDLMNANSVALDQYLLAFDDVVHATEAMDAQQKLMDEQSSVIVSAIEAALNGIDEERKQQSILVTLELSIGLTLAIAVGGVTAWLVSRQIVIPLRRAVTVARSIADGDLSENIETRSRDEVGELLRAMQDMTISLRTMAQGIRTGVSRVNGAVVELERQSTVGSDGALVQQLEVEQIASSIQQMAVTISEVAHSTEEASMAAVAAQAFSHKGVAVITGTLQQMERLKGDVERLDNAIQTVSHGSVLIIKVVDVIKSVAEQTNLLALNAAIEAARAGEAGRGFAVVADEVRGLAIRTQSSTLEIESLVASLQSGNQNAENLMSSSRQRTVEAVVLTRSAQGVLDEINQSVAHIQQLNLLIATATEQQSAVAQEISSNVSRVRTLAQSTAVAAEATLHSSAGLRDLAAQLSGMADIYRC